MKLYGIKIEKNENGKEVALLEITREEIAELMDCTNAATLYWHKDAETLEEIAREKWMQLYEIKYSNLWKK